MTEPTSTEPTATSQLHGVLLRVLDTGVLLVGESGIGKSECALELITKGHQLVADDAVEIHVDGGKIKGRPPKLTRGLLEIRGLGIFDVAMTFGQASVCDGSEVDLCIELRKSFEPEPLEDPVSEYLIADCSVPRFILPVGRGCDLATLVETAVRIHRTGSAATTTALLIEEHTKLVDSVQ